MYKHLIGYIMKKLCALLLLFVLQTHFLESCFSRKERLGLVEKKIEQKQKTIDPLDHMAAIAGLMRLFGYVDILSNRKYESYASCLASRLISEHDAAKFFFMVKRGSISTKMFVSSKSSSKKLDELKNPRILDAHRIAEFTTSIQYRQDSYRQDVCSKRVLVNLESEPSDSRFTEVVVARNSLQGIHLIAKTFSDGLLCNYYMTDQEYYSSKPLGRSWYPNHQIVVEACAFNSRVCLYAIPDKPGYKDKDV